MDGCRSRSMPGSWPSVPHKLHSYDSIRAALGVSSDEIRDEGPEPSIYDDHLSSDLRTYTLGVDAYTQR